MRPVRIVIFPVFVVLLNGCIPCYYGPSAQNVPLLKESGTGNASLGMKIGVYSIGCDLQNAVALTDHVGLMLNYSYFSGSKNNIYAWETEMDQRFKSHLVELGIGYYRPFSDMFLFEMYGGAGLDWIKNKYVYFDGGGSSKLESACYFIQPAFGFYRKNIELAFSLRLRIVDYFQLSYDWGTTQDIINELVNIKEYPAVTFLEPALTLRTGGKAVKFQFQSGFSKILSNNYIDYDPLNINLGIIYTFGKVKKKGTSLPDQNP